MTPEGKVKDKVDKVLKTAKAEGLPLWWCKPVTYGFGASLLDYIGVANGRAFAIETKAVNGRVTPRQDATMSEMRNAGAAVFLVRGESPDDLAALKQWLLERRKETL